MAKPSAFVILCGLCSWMNIHGGHRWHRILKYNYALHVQISFILQSLKVYKMDEVGVFIIPCFSVRSATDNIPNQPIL
jgi:hypothetical protein